MKRYLDYIDSSEERYKKRANKIDSVVKSITSGKEEKDWPKTIEKINSKSALNQRFKYLSRKFSSQFDVTKERVLNNSDFVHINYLEKGLLAARSVGRVVVKKKSGGLLGYGSGFLVSPRLLLTNNHVLETKLEAASSELELNFEYDINGRIEPYYVFKLRPDVFHLASPFKELDYTLVAVEEYDFHGRKKLSDFGFLPLIEETGKIAKGENLTIIQHPRGDFKQIAMRENELVDKDEKYLRYMTDTARGSSGSSVLNDQWEVVALHHSGVPRRDEQGRIKKKDGSLWRKNIDHDEDIDWKSNEGIRISCIIKDIKKRLKNASSPTKENKALFSSF